MTPRATSLELFDVTLQKTDLWLGHLMRLLPTDDRHVAYPALRVTLHALRDRLRSKRLRSSARNCRC
jgi:uncharacterized protein (DUF2267 family)